LILSARRSPAKAANNEFADMRAAYDTTTTDAAMIEDMVCETFGLYSRGSMGFSD